MNRQIIFIALSILSICWNLEAQVGCPDCQIEINNLPEDTIFLGDLNQGEVGKLYDEDLSFRLPKTTTPVFAIDSTTPPGLNITKFEIVGLTNLPPGLNYEVNQDEFDPRDQTDGCAKICGTPTSSGQFFVTVELKATVFGLSQSSSFDFEMLIFPEQDTSRLYQVLQTSGCGELTTSFINNFPSNGNPGITYSWIFGNGETSTEENPGPVTYPWVGVYTSNLSVVVDTFPAQLSQLTIVNAECNDFFGGKPDLYFVIEEMNGTEIFRSDEIQNADFPASFNLNVEFEIRDYRLKVFDDDNLLGGADDLCGEVIFNPDQTVAITDTINEMEVIMSFFKPTNRFFESETITVFAAPPSPDITPDNSQAKCIGETLLTASVNQNLEWFYNGDSISTDSVVGVNRSGEYWAVFTDPISSCSSVSDTAVIADLTFPSQPVLSSDSDNLKCNGDVELTSNITDNITWLSGMDTISTNQTIAINEAGVYQVHHTNPNTGCTTISDELNIGEVILPITPLVSPDNFQVNCREDLELTSSETSDIIWFFNGDSLANSTSVFALNSGNYWVENIDLLTGCSSSSDTVFVPELEFPNTPEFVNVGNQLTLLPDVVLPDNFSLQWFMDGNIIQGENGATFCIENSGVYTLVVTNLDTDCTSEFEMDLIFDENMNCTSSISETYDLSTIARVFPNPNNGNFKIEIKDNSISTWAVNLFSIGGKLVFQGNYEGTNASIYANDLSDGIFILKVTTNNGTYASKIVKK